MFRGSALAIAVSLLLGCNAKLMRLETRGQHDAVIDAAAERRWPPRRQGARALASALVAVGHVERARDVLLGDFRRGGQLASLVQLADLERTLGRDGLAAVHYSRVHRLDRTVLRGRRDVCALLGARASAWLRLGEGEAALDDLDAVRTLCGTDDGVLRRGAEARLSATLRARAARTSCGLDCGRAAPGIDLAAALDAARAESPAALRRLAARERLVLPHDDVLALLLADVRGHAGAVLVDDDELRGWLGDAAAEAFVAGVRGLPVPEGAYVRLRLERVLGRSPDGGAATPSQRALWLDRASVIEGAVRWRLLAHAGDLVAAEQDLVARWRPRAVPDPSTPTDPADDVVVPTARHWSLRVPIERPADLELLTFARLRDAGGDHDLALELARATLRSAHRLGLDGAAEAARAEVEHALGWGRPWLALALADAVGTADIEPHRRAAAAAILLGEALCEGPCAEDGADTEAIVRTLGEPWLAEQRARLREIALGPAGPAAPAGACPGLGEVLAPGADSPLARALAEVRAGATVGVARRLVGAIESDVALVCAARFAVPLLLDLDARVSAARLSDHLAHGDRLPVSSALTVHAAMAALGHQPTRAEHLAIAAAAAADDPRAAWRPLARVARRAGVPLEALALRELLLHAPGFVDDAARRELLARSIVDGARAWGPRDTPAGRESVARLVDDHLSRLDAARRWAEREAIFAAVARIGLDAAVLEVVARVLLTDEHARALGVGAAAESAASDAAAIWSARRLARAAEARALAEVPISVRVFADVHRTAPLRAALARAGRDWGVRRRAAIGLAAIGTPAERAAGVAELLAMTTPATRVELERLLLAQPAAIDVGAGAVSSSVVADDVVLLHLLFGSSPADALWLEPEPTGAP